MTAMGIQICGPIPPPHKAPEGHPSQAGVPYLQETILIPYHIQRASGRSSEHQRGNMV